MEQIQLSDVKNNVYDVVRSVSLSGKSVLITDNGKDLATIVPGRPDEKDACGQFSSESPEFRLHHPVGTAGSCLKGVLVVSPALMVRTFGEPVEDEYIFVGQNEEVFKIYDRRLNSYDCDKEFNKVFPDVETFWRSEEPFEFSVGGRTRPDPFFRWIGMAFQGKCEARCWPNIIDREVMIRQLLESAAKKKRTTSKRKSARKP